MVYSWKSEHNNGGLKFYVFPYVPIPQAGTLQASAREQVLQTDVHSAGHDGLSLPALVDCLQDSPRKADVHSAGHDGLSLPALVDCLQDSPRKVRNIF
jgi:hypothetical protein